MLTIDTACADLADSEFMLKKLNAQEERKVNAEKNEIEVDANDSSKKMISTPVKIKGNIPVLTRKERKQCVKTLMMMKKMYIVHTSYIHVHCTYIHIYMYIVHTYIYTCTLYIHTYIHTSHCTAAQKRMKQLHKNLDDDEKDALCSTDTERKKEIRKHLDDDDEKDALCSTDTERKKEIRKHLDDDDEKNAHHTEFYL